MTETQIPSYRKAIFSTQDACAILATTRNTMAAQMVRYDDLLAPLGLEPGVRGVPRSFTMEQLGLFAVMRSAFPVKQAEAVLQSMDRIVPKAEQIYADSKIELVERRMPNGGMEQRPIIKDVPKPAYLEGRIYLGSTWLFEPVGPEKGSYGNIAWQEFKDSAGYPLVRILLPFEATLRNTWTRALWRRDGIAIDDVEAA